MGRGLRRGLKVAGRLPRPVEVPGHDRHGKHEGQKFEDVLREFICLFEHSEFRIRQLLFRTAAKQADDRQRKQVGRWLAFIYRACTYAILAVWFDYKRETTTGHIHVNLSTGETREDWHHEPMWGPPRRHRRGKI